MIFYFFCSKELEEREKKKIERITKKRGDKIDPPTFLFLEKLNNPGDLNTRTN
jgi:hypothetical protein